MKKNYCKLIEDTTFKNEYAGKHFEPSWYKYIIDSDQDGYYTLEGKDFILFKFRKNVISEKYSKIAVDSFLELSKKKHSNRGIAAGIPEGQSNARHLTKSGQSEGGYIASNISGYFDRPLREHRGTLGTIRACRTTAFTLNNKELWSSGLPFIKHCSNLFKRFAPKEYSIQQQEWDSLNLNLKIPNTVFTTITSNYNWRTACHCDAGDFSKGLGNLIVVGKDFTGGYLGFPQFKVLIKIKPGDFLLMDSHQWHCNTPIKVGENGFRLSFVMYIREDIKLCKHKKVIDSNVYFI
jgi:hypothetical protein